MLQAVDSNDYAAANQGQVKWIATRAALELDARLPGGAGSAVSNLINAFSLTNNYAMVNNGQLKNTAKPFCDRLIDVGYTNSYPWTPLIGDDVDYAAVNIGQVKHVFAFDLVADADEDDLYDWWEMVHMGSLDYDADDDNDRDGFLNGFEFRHGSDPWSPLSTPRADYYVSPEGTDANDGKSLSTPFFSIQKAVNTCSADQYEIIQLADGTYTGESNRNISVSKSVTICSTNGPRNCIIHCNDSGRGFICITENDPVALVGLTIKDGKITSQSDDGAGILISDSIFVLLKSCIIESCESTGASGGGIALSMACARIDDCVIKNNYAKHKGGGILSYMSHATMVVDSTISSNTLAVNQQNKGAGIHISDNSANIVISNTVFIANGKDTGYSSKAWKGGAVCLENTPNEVTFAQCVFSNNFAREYGGACALYNSLVTVRGSTFANNGLAGGLMYMHGGALYVDSVGIGDVTFENSIFRTNRSIVGGAVYSSSYYGDLLFKNCLFEANRGKGAGLYGNNVDNLTLNGCIFSNNQAVTFGGGVFLNNGSAAKVKNCLFIHNSAGMQGAGLAISNSSPTIINCTLIDNAASSSGGGLQLWNSSGTTIKNDILWSNQPQQVAYAGSQPSISYCNIQQNGYAGSNGNISSWPAFYGLYRLATTNDACFDAGQNSGAPDTDVDGETRPFRNAVDIGWDELIDSDGDDLVDLWELEIYGALYNTWDRDPDADGLTDRQEQQIGTDPRNPDTDGDLIPDGVDANPLLYDISPLIITVTYPTNQMTIP